MSFGMLGRRVLAVASRVQTALPGRGSRRCGRLRLAGAAGVPDKSEQGEARGQGEDAGGGIIVGAVVHVDDLVRSEGHAGRDDRIGVKIEVFASFFSGTTMESQGIGSVCAEAFGEVCGDIGCALPGPPHLDAPTGIRAMAFGLVGVRGFEPPTPCSRSSTLRWLRSDAPGCLMRSSPAQRAIETPALRKRLAFAARLVRACSLRLGHAVGEDRAPIVLHADDRPASALASSISAWLNVPT